MIRGLYPNQWLPKGQKRLNSPKTAVATIGTTVTISQNTGATYSGLTLATMREANPTNNYNPNGPIGNGHEIQTYAAGDRAHILVNVSGLSNITSGTVVSAVFKFYVPVGLVNNTFNIVMRKMLAASDVTQATWNNRLTGIAWGTAGCLGDGVDRNSSIIARGVITLATTGAIEISGSALNQAVQDLINGASTVYWFEIEDENDTAYNGDYVQFVSQAQTDGQRPTLTVVLTAATSINVSLAGVQAAASQGTITTNASKPIAGTQANTSQGAIAPALAIPLAGVQAASSQSAVTYSTVASTLELSLSGVQATSSRGSISLSGAIIPAGQQVTTTQGAISLSGAINCTGQQVTTTQGAISLSGTIIPTGQQATSSRGSISLSGAINCTGQQVTATQGAISLSGTIIPTGQQVTATQGAISLSGTIIPTGQQVIATQGTVQPAAQSIITGIPSSTAQGLIALSGATLLPIQMAQASQGSVVYSAPSTSLELSIAGVQAKASQGSIAYVASNVVTRRPKRNILRPIIDVRAASTSGMVKVRSGVALIYEAPTNNAVALTLTNKRICICKYEIVKIKAGSNAIARPNVAASIYAEKEAKLHTSSSVHTTSRLVTVISGLAMGKIIAAAYPQGYVTRARGGDPSYIHTTRYS